MVLTIIACILVVALVVVWQKVAEPLLDRKEQAKQKLIEAMKFEAKRKEEQRLRMAELRKRKELKKAEREKEAEQKLIEAMKLEEEWKKEEKRQEREERKENKRKEVEKNNLLKSLRVTMEELGISDYAYSLGSSEYSYYVYSLSARTDRLVDFNKIFELATKLNLGKMRIDVIRDIPLEISINYSQRVFSAKYSDSDWKNYHSERKLKKYLWCLQETYKLQTARNHIEHILDDGVTEAIKLGSNKQDLSEQVVEILSSSNYYGLFEKRVAAFINGELALIEYDLPIRDVFRWEKEYKYIASDNSAKIIMLTESAIAKIYENILYSICLRSIHEVCVSIKSEAVKTIAFNGFVSSVNKANGLNERKCILSLQVNRSKFLGINIKDVDPKQCFKALKGVSAARLIDVTPIQPILSLNKNDHRFIAAKDISLDAGTNLASMDWEEFEHLVRELFELEFSKNGGEVRVTQASRDGGVDAIVFDPDPLRGGKIVIQAKRYTNTVGVSAVRDLYGTVINEGANSGILITTSDYGHDSYEFAKDKPLKLLNGGHLLALLHKNGRKGYINIQEAKDKLAEEV